MSEAKKYQKSIDDLVANGLTKNDAREIIERQSSLSFIHDILMWRDITLDIIATDGGLEFN
tara:strand:- start:2650 stop:2832 length:183 start_codon:yes stop_codon:yes gene_type:complete